MLFPYPYQISASVLGWLGRDREPDLPAFSPELPVSRRFGMLCQLPDSIFNCLMQVVLISNLCGCIDLPQMYCGGLGMSLNPGIVPLLNFLPAVVFRLVPDYVMSVE